MRRELKRILVVEDDAEVRAYLSEAYQSQL